MPASAVHRVESSIGATRITFPHLLEVPPNRFEGVSLLLDLGLGANPTSPE